jgi:hypothetical protein
LKRLLASGPQTHRLGELRPNDPSPVVEALPNHVDGQSICGGLQSSGIGNREEGVIVLAEVDLLAEQFAFDVGMAVEVVGDVERRAPGVFMPFS